MKIGKTVIYSVYESVDKLLYSAYISLDKSIGIPVSDSVRVSLWRSVENSILPINNKRNANW
jgi:hypothetical protein